MKMQLLGSVRMLVYGALAVFALCGQPARGELLTAELNCVLAGSSAVSCDPMFHYGRVTLDDSVVAGQISLTVDMQGIAGKFRDLMLNFDGPGITSVSSGDGQASLLPGGYSLSPYNDGKFDIGGTGHQGWHSGTALYTTLLGGNGALTLDMFNVRDSLGNLNVALHLQNLTPTGGSLKVGGIWEGCAVPSQEAPEPATTALLGGGLVALAWILRRRRAA